MSSCTKPCRIGIQTMGQVYVQMRRQARSGEAYGSRKEVGGMNLIYVQKNGKMTEVDRLALGELLLKAGYNVRLTKRRVPGGPADKSIPVIEFKGDGEP